MARGRAWRTSKNGGKFIKIKFAQASRQAISKAMRKRHKIKQSRHRTKRVKRHNKAVLDALKKAAAIATRMAIYRHRAAGNTRNDESVRPVSS